MGFELFLGALLLSSVGLAVAAGRLWRRARRAEATASMRLLAIEAVGSAAGQAGLASSCPLQPVVGGLGRLCFSNVEVLVLDEPSGRWLRRGASEDGDQSPDTLVLQAARRAWDAGGAVLEGGDPRLVACPVPSEAVSAVVVAKCDRSWGDDTERAAVAAFAGVLGATGTVFDPPPTRRDAAEQRPSGPVDSLTGLTSSSAFLQALQRRCEDRSVSAGLLLVAVDGVERVSSEFGTRSGDEVLRIIARRLRRCLRSDDEVSRTAPAVFGILLAEADDPDGAISVGSRVLAALQSPVAVTGAEVRVAPRVCVAWAGNGSLDAATLLAQATEALQRADQEIVTSIQLGDSSSGLPAGPASATGGPAGSTDVVR